jgi:hypothetical protein
MPNLIVPGKGRSPYEWPTGENGNRAIEGAGMLRCFFP